MFKVSVLASGSKGNCLIVRSREHAVILDAGIPLKRIFGALERLSIDRSLIRGILVSHEHSDHTGSVGALSRNLKIPVFITRDTLMCASNKLGNLYDRFWIMKNGESFELGDILIHPFRSSHDAIDSSNFTFQHLDIPGLKLGVATDLGFPIKTTLFHLSGCSTLVLESNHDLPMLMNGRYEWFLKQRIKDDKGHLSNEQAVGLVSQIIHPGLRQLILAHLSEENNRPEIAYETMNSYLKTIRSDVRLMIASQDYETELLDI